MAEQDKKVMTLDEKRAEIAKNKNLKNVEDHVLSLALKILDCSEFQYMESIYDDGRYDLESNVIQFCYPGKNDLTPEQWCELLDHKETGEYKKLFTQNGTKNHLYTGFNPITCDGCHCANCVKEVLGSLLIFRQQGVLKQKLEERKKSVGHFQFQWETDKDLEYVPEKVFSIAKDIVDSNKLCLQSHVYSDRTRISCGFNCDQIGRFCNCGEINEEAISSQSKWIYLTRDFDTPMTNLCTNMTCRLPACALVVGGRIDYLQKMGLQAKIDEAREKYKADPKRYDDMAQKSFDERLERYLATRIDVNISKDLVEKFQNQVDNLELLGESIANKDRNNLYFAIEREEGLDDTALIGQIESSLKSLDKITQRNDMQIGAFRNSCSSNDNERKLYVLDGIYDFLNNGDVASKKTVDTEFIEMMTHPTRNMYIVVVGTREELDRLYAYSEKIKYVYKHFKVTMRNLTTDQLYAIYKSHLEAVPLEALNHNEAEGRAKFDDFVANNRSIFPFKNTHFAKYIAQYSNSCNALIFPPYAYYMHTLDDSLSGVVGLQSIKNQIKDLEQHIIFINKAKSMGLSVPKLKMHMAFAGGAGTGKTMMGKIITRMLYDIGAIKENKFIEVGRKDLIAQYTGQTAPKTMEVLNSAVGGVLCIDGASTLTDSFGKDAVEAISKFIENDENNLVIIFSDKRDEMKVFLEKNAIIATNIGYTFEFNNHTPAELTEMFNKQMKSYGFILNEGALASATAIFKIFAKHKDFGNGRFVERMVQKTLATHSKHHGDDLLTITEDSIPTIEVLTGEISDRRDPSEMMNEIVGMRSLKKQISELVDYVQFSKDAKNSGITLPDLSMHMLFTGNPGTGKTMMARIVARMLFDVGILHENKLVEVERKDLVAEYIGQTAPKTAEVIERAMGGVLFIDEAYSLTPKDSHRDFGQEAIATLIKAMEDHKDNLIIIFAGYRDEMSHFVNSNPGIASRIGYKFHFDDYSPDELCEILDVKLHKNNLKISDDAKQQFLHIAKIAKRSKNFGNGRFVDRALQYMLTNHAKLHGPDLSLIELPSIPTIDELNGAGEKNNVDLNLSDIVGMTRLKTQISEFADYLQFAAQSHQFGIELPVQNMHMLFTGNPGTGKTMIARVVSKMLFDLDVLHENKLIEVESKDLIAQYIGQTTAKTSELIDRAMGGVLFIDEAYALTKSSYGEEAIATLIKAMEDHKGEFVVIFAGYRDEMKGFVDINPGIASRIGYTFHFDDYSPDELIDILKIKLDKAKMKMTERALDESKRIIEIMCKRKNFGNGRFIDNFLQQTLNNHARCHLDDLTIIDVHAIPSVEEMNGTGDIEKHADLSFDGIVGMETLKAQVQEFADYIQFSQKARNLGLNLPVQNMHMLFTGNPGTGKTMMARIIAKMLFDLDVLHENKVIEVERKDLVGQYLGQTAPKTAEVIDRAMGGVLFIDEAYSLTLADAYRDSYGDEVVATLIKAMEDKKGQFVVIFAGYKKEMKKFLNSNSGIASRIGYTFDFPDYSPDELTQIYKMKLEKAGFIPSEDAIDAAKKIMNYFHRVENIGNGRFVDRITQQTIMKRSKDLSGELNIITDVYVPTIDEVTKTLANGSSIMKPLDNDTKTQKSIAVHEIGHAYVRYKLYDDPKFIKITINAEGTGTLGYVSYENDSVGIQTKSALMNQIKVSLAGMCCEEFLFGEFSNGNTSDLENATSIAEAMVTRYGMSSLGFAQIRDDKSLVVQKEINNILNECYVETKKILSENKQDILRLSNYLLNKKELTGEEFLKVVKGTKSGG